MVGFHNGWIVVNDLPSLHKDKEKTSPRHASPTKNISKVLHSIVDNKKSQPPHTVFNSIRLIVSAKP